MSEKIKLSKNDRLAVAWRSTFLQGSWNYERMQNLGWAFSLIPAIKKLYTTKEDRAAALTRHMEFFNTHPYVASPIIGVTLALEEERANGAPIDDVAIQGVKVGMMGPLAGIGDPVFWFTVRPILGAIGASLALSGNILGPILFFVLWNVIRWAFIWYTQEFGYKAGSSITSDLSGGLLQDITKGASILGMFILAVLVEHWVSIKFALDVSKVKLSEGAYIEWDKLPAGGKGIQEAFQKVGEGLSQTPDKVTTLQQNLDGLIPGLNAQKFDAAIAGMSITPERLEVVEFSDPYFYTGIILIGKKGDNISVDDLKAQPIASQRATVAAKYLQDEHSDADIKLYDTQDNAYLDLTSGRVRAMMSDKVTGIDWLKTPAGQDYEVKGAEISTDDDAMGIAFRKADPLVAKFNAALAELKANGSYDQITSSYFGTSTTAAAQNTVVDDAEVVDGEPVKVAN